MSGPVRIALRGAAGSPGPGDDTEGLCQACGLCCDGSLFVAVPLEPDESVPGGAADGAGRLVQPCAFHAGTCGIYAGRPEGCRAFTCRVFAAVAEGRRDRAWAEARIDDMRHILAGLDDALPGRGGSIYGRAVRYLEDVTAAAGDPRVRARIAAYEDMLGLFRPLRISAAEAADPGGRD